MSLNNAPIYIPNLDQVIDRCPLTVTSDTSVSEVIALMGQIRSSCNLSENIPSPAIAYMGEQRASCVLVTQEKKLLGIFTERDLVKLIASGRDFTCLKICEVMTQPLITLTHTKTQDIFSALLLLRQHQIRHLPILDPQGELLGVVTPESIRPRLLQPVNLLKWRYVAEVMTSRVIQAPPSACVLDIAQLMAKYRVSCVVIAEQTPGDNSSREQLSSWPIGVVTERDIVQLQALQLDLGRMEARTIMSTPLFCVTPDDSLWTVYEQMQKHYVRRMIVCSQQGELLGIVTQTNLMRVLDPMEMSGAIELLQRVVDKRTSELKQAVEQLQNEIAERQKAEERLRLLESAVVNANDAIVILDAGESDRADPRIVYVNQAFTQMSGYQLEEIVGHTVSDLRGPKTDPVQVAQIRTAFIEQKPLRIELINYRKDGTEYWVELNSVPVIGDRSSLHHWVSVQRDITERKQMEQALFQEKELAQVTLQSIADAVIRTDATGRIEYINPVAEKLTGWSNTQAQGWPIEQVVRIINDITGEAVENPVQTCLETGAVIATNHHTTLIAHDGREFAIDHSAAPIHTREGEIIGVVLVFRDVTERRTLARQLTWQASHDALTTLINRREFEKRLKEAVLSAKQQQHEHILAYLDLDRFKIVNDTCGHIAGDELLRQVTALFQSRVRKTDALARVGGDEFGLLLYQCPLEQGLQIVEGIRESVESFRFVWQDKTFSIGVSIGLVKIQGQNASASAVLSAADAACYGAKAKGRNRIQVYEAQAGDVAQQQGEMQWVSRLNQGLQEHSFCLYYQPIVPFAESEAGKIYQEVLLRFQDPDGTLISPMAFIPTAERYQLMHVIDQWVIRTLFGHLSFVIRHLSLTPELGSKRLSLEGETLLEPWNHLYSINLSAVTIKDEGFIPFLLEQFQRHSIPPHSICFEIAENVAIANLTKVTSVIHALKEIGCQVALDNFGSGMSSFAYLKNLAVDYIKIDGNFVKTIGNNSIDLAMVEAINRIGHVMGVKTIAECVESEAVCLQLKALGVDYGQGYWLGKPQPLHLSVSANNRDLLSVVTSQLAS